ncbi:MAG: transporter [Ginsengibacter sp.]
MICSLASLIFAIFPLSAHAQSDTIIPKITHHQYNLLNPVPKNQMKEMETDRPDVTESAYTVEPGHFQIETDLYKFVRNRDNKTKSTVHIFNLGNYKLGLSKRADIQFVIPTYVSNNVRKTNTNQIISRTGGFDDITLRFKYNIWGYSGGKTALAALPFISFPTSSFSNNGIQGGIVFPFALKINEKLDFGTQAEIDLVKESNNKYHPEYLYSFTFGKPFSSKISGFVEAVFIYNPNANHTDIFANGGIIYSFSENFNIDAGLNYGIKRNADKIFFAGFSFRL